MHPSERGRILLGDLLLALADELDDLSTSATSLQTALGAVVERAGQSGESVDGMWHLQEMDRLEQTLDDIAAILRQAAGQEGSSLNVDALASVALLGALRDRLRGNIAPSSCDAGSVALF